MSGKRSGGRIRTLIALVVVASSTLLLGAACSSSDSDTAQGSAKPTATSSTSTSTSTTAPEAASATAQSGDSSASTPPPVEIVGVDYAFEDVPASVPAGTQLKLKNDSTDEVHEVVAIPLPPDEKRPAADLVKLGEDGLKKLAAGPPQVIVAPPESEGFPVQGTGVLEQPGRYLLVCAIPVGADPQEYMAAAKAAGGQPQGFSGEPHFMKGMYADVTVTA